MRNELVINLQTWTYTLVLEEFEVSLPIPHAERLVELANGDTSEVEGVEVPAMVYQDIMDAILNDPVLKEAADAYPSCG